MPLREGPATARRPERASAIIRPTDHTAGRGSAPYLAPDASGPPRVGNRQSAPSSRADPHHQVPLCTAPPGRNARSSAPVVRWRATHSGASRQTATAGGADQLPEPFQVPCPWPQNLAQLRLRADDVLICKHPTVCHVYAPKYLIMQRFRAISRPHLQAFQLFATLSLLSI